MHFYEIAIGGLDLKPLTYAGELELKSFCEVLVPVRGKTQKGVIISEVPEPKFETQNILEPTGAVFTPFQVSLAKFIARYYTCSLGVAFGLFTPISNLNNNSNLKSQIKFELSPNLSDLQRQALDFTLSQDTALIFGDTGSGKSEIYIERIRRVLNSGAQALLLMPEISLTPQMQKRLESYFEGAVGVWHSKITPKKRSALLEGLASGKIRLIAGARSALFLPFSRLGLIVVDEEHDDSYKNGASPFYHARDLCVWAGQNAKIPVVLGSATPSITSLAKFPYFRLAGTFFASHKEFVFDPSPTSLSPLVREGLAATLSRGKQIVVFLPTRANFKFLRCTSCGATIKCPFCSVSLSLHRELGALKCHYCGYAERIPAKCPECGEPMLEARKIGTSELKKQIEHEFPSARVAKFDRDEITTQRKLEALLKDFNERKIDVVVGTQMLSKGHDYHGVELAIIMGLDDQLEYCDFRAREKTLALAMQVAGRAGRAGSGRVIIQTLRKDFFERFLENYEAFAKDELKARNPLYPPFTRLLRIIIQERSETKAQKIESEILAAISNLKDLEIIGHGKAPVELVALKHRRQILVRAASHAPLLRAAIAARNLGGHPDIDPVNFS